MASVEPCVSVIVPAFNVEGWIGAALRSLKAQTMADFEALVIDDGSTDATHEAAVQAIGADPRFRVIWQENGGLSRARNAGLDLARGRFIAFLDGDDTLAPGFLHGLLAQVQATGAAWAACAIDMVYADRVEGHSALHGVPFGQESSSTLVLDDSARVAQVFPSAWNKLYRCDLFNGLRFTPDTWFEDHEVFWTLAARHPHLAYVGQPLYRYRQDRPGQITAADDERVFDQLDVLARLAPLVRGGRFANGAVGFSRLATRLAHERLQAIRAPGRRSRFLDAVGRSMRDLDWRCDSAGAGDIDAALPTLLTPPLAVDVVLVPCPQLEVRRESVGAQIAPAGSVRIISADTEPTAPWFLVLGPGEALVPGGLRVLTAVAHRTGADACHGAHWRTDGGHDDGWTDNRVAGLPATDWGVEGVCLPMPPALHPALRLAPVRAARLFRTAALTPEQRRALMTPEQIMAQAALWDAAATPGLVHAQSRAPVARLLADPPAPSLRQLRANIARLNPPTGWQGGDAWRGVLTLRALRVARVRNRLSWLGALAWLWWRGWLPGAPPLAADPETPRWVRGVLWWRQR